MGYFALRSRVYESADVCQIMECTNANKKRYPCAPQNAGFEPWPGNARDARQAEQTSRWKKQTDSKWGFRANTPAPTSRKGALAPQHTPGELCSEPDSNQACLCHATVSHKLRTPGTHGALALKSAATVSSSDSKAPCAMGFSGPRSPPGCSEHLAHFWWLAPKVLPLQQLVVFPVSLVHAYLAVRHSAGQTHNRRFASLEWQKFQF